MTKFEDIPKAKRNLLAFCPFIASFLFGLKMIIDDSPRNKHQTAYTDGKVIAFSTKFLAELSFKQLVTLIAHEVAHVAFAHHFRMGEKDHELWNVACDYAINFLLVSMGFEALPNWLYDVKYRGMSAEDIYTRLKQESPEQQDKKKEQSQQSGGSFEEPKNSDGSSMDGEQLEEAKQKAKGKLVQAKGNMQKAMKAIEESTMSPQDKAELKRNAGRGMREVFKDIEFETDSRVDWHDVLSRFLTSLAKNDFAVHVPDQRFVDGNEFLMPSFYSEEIGNIFFALDTSGSCAMVAKQFVTEAREILERMEGADNSELKACYCSDYVHRIDTIESADDIKLIYGGGTSFKPAVDAFAEDATSDALIYVTDGCVYPQDASQHGEDPGRPVLWVLTRRNDDFKPAFGEIVHFNS